MPTRSSRAVTARYPRSKARRRHPSRWPWVIVAALLALALYVTWSEQLSAPAPIRVGIVAGHWQYDSGAVCPDGLREVDIAFRRIHPDTPAAIVELGFMGGDRHLLANQQERVASGIVEGLLAYLSVRAEAQQAPTPKR